MGMPAQLSGNTLLGSLRWQAILAGFVTDVGTTQVFGFVVGIVAGVATAAHGANPAEASGIFFQSTRLMVIFGAIGSLFTVVGGFVTGRLAPRARYWNVSVMVVIDMLYGLVDYSPKVPLWLNITLFAAALPCAFLGAFLAGFFVRPEAQPPPLPQR